MQTETTKALRVMVVDRDQKVRALAERALRPPEFEAHTFASGGAALAKVEQVRPDCVVSDASLPDMQCELFLSALRARAGLERVPAVAMSVARSEARIRAVLDAGFDAYVLKPFPLHELLGKVRALLPAASDPVRPRRPTPPDEVPTTPIAGGKAPTNGRRKSEGAAAAPPPTTPGPPLAGGRQGPWSQVAAQGGLYTRVERGGRSLVVLTEAKAHPRFVIITVITENGWALRKVSSELPHALARDDDREMVQRQIELQHQTVLHSLDTLVLDSTSRRVVWSRGLVP